MHVLLLCVCMCVCIYECIHTLLDYYPNSRSTREYRQLVALQYGVQDNKELCTRLTLHQIFTENSTSRGGPYLYTATPFIDMSVCLF